MGREHADGHEPSAENEPSDREGSPQHWSPPVINYSQAHTEARSACTAVLLNPRTAGLAVGIERVPGRGFSGCVESAPPDRRLSPRSKSPAGSRRCGTRAPWGADAGQRRDVVELPHDALGAHPCDGVAGRKIDREQAARASALCLVSAGSSARPWNVRSRGGKARSARSRRRSRGLAGNRGRTRRARTCRGPVDEAEIAGPESSTYTRPCARGANAASTGPHREFAGRMSIRSAGGGGRASRRPRRPAGGLTYRGRPSPCDPFRWQRSSAASRETNGGRHSGRKLYPLVERRQATEQRVDEHRPAVRQRCRCRGRRARR